MSCCATHGKGSLTLCWCGSSTGLPGPCGNSCRRSHFGLRVFFELKDREFGLGDAYPFAIRLGRYGGRYGVVITTDRVAEDSKGFFAEQQRSEVPAGIDVLESQEKIESGIKQLIDRYSRVSVNETIRDLTEYIGMSLTPVISAWMTSVASRASRPERPISPLMNEAVAASVEDVAHQAGTTGPYPS